MNFNMEKLMNFNTIVDDTNGARDGHTSVDLISCARDRKFRQTSLRGVTRLPDNIKICQKLSKKILFQVLLKDICRIHIFMCVCNDFSSKVTLLLCLIFINEVLDFFRNITKQS